MLCAEYIDDNFLVPCNITLYVTDLAPKVVPVFWQVARPWAKISTFGDHEVKYIVVLLWNLQLLCHAYISLFHSTCSWHVKSCVKRCWNVMLWYHCFKLIPSANNPRHFLSHWNGFTVLKQWDYYSNKVTVRNSEFIEISSTVIFQ